MGYIYLINELGTNNYKIGVTKGNIEKRKKPLQTGNSDELFLTRKFQTENPYKLEKFLHRYYHKEHKNGEWFILSDEQVLDFINICEKYTETITVLISENPFY